MYLRLMILVISAWMLGTSGLWSFGETVQANAIQAGEAARQTVWDGVYADAQAAGGRALYEEYCTNCHLKNLSGGGSDPPLVGDKWMENWREDNLASLFRKIKTTMPRRSNKVLSDGETLEAISYILSENGFPAGTELELSALDRIHIQRKDGPQPLPNYALLEVVGCLTQEGNAWALTMVDQARRRRGAAEGPTPDELRAAESAPLGSRTFRLQNLILIGDFQPEAHQGHKMLAWGALIRRSGVENISVTALEMVDEDCGQ